MLEVKLSMLNMRSCSSLDRSLTVRSPPTGWLSGTGTGNRHGGARACAWPMEDHGVASRWRQRAGGRASAGRRGGGAASIAPCRTIVEAVIALDRAWRPMSCFKRVPWGRGWVWSRSSSTRRSRSSGAKIPSRRPSARNLSISDFYRYPQITSTMGGGKKRKSRGPRRDDRRDRPFEDLRSGNAGPQSGGRPAKRPAPSQLPPIDREKVSDLGRLIVRPSQRRYVPSPAPS